MTVRLEQLEALARNVLRHEVDGAVRLQLGLVFRGDVQQLDGPTLVEAADDCDKLLQALRELAE